MGTHQKASRSWAASYLLDINLPAVSAKVRDWTLATRNTSDLARRGVALLSPFGGPA